MSEQSRRMLDRDLTDENVKGLLQTFGLDEKSWNEWIYGQTVYQGEDGKVRYFAHDVERYLRLKLHGTPTYFD